MKRQILWLSACLVAASGTATAAGFQWLPDSAAWTEPAGTSGATKVESQVTAEYYGLQALKIWDFDARACSLQLEQSSFNAPSPHPLDPLRMCEPKQTQAWKRADVGSGLFVRAISVCTAKGAGAEIHGVELWGASIGPNGKLKPAKESVKLEFSRCEKWSPRRECPAGSVATGVRAELGASDIGAVGLALSCHALAPAP